MRRSTVVAQCDDNDATVTMCNATVLQRSRDVTVAICDMGIAQLKKTSEATKTSIEGMGTYPYMAPEMMQEHAHMGQSIRYLLSLAVSS